TVLEDILEDALKYKLTIIFDLSSSSESEFAQSWSKYKAALSIKSGCLNLELGWPDSE
ncbi:9960_t:CDS:2, partial [Cetraspora pellucida]